MKKNHPHPKIIKITFRNRKSDFKISNIIYKKNVHLNITDLRKCNNFRMAIKSTIFSQFINLKATQIKILNLNDLFGCSLNSKS